MTDRDFEKCWSELEHKLAKLTESEKQEVLARAELILKERGVEAAFESDDKT